MLKVMLPISTVIALRFLGLFIVLPVLSIYALELKGANEILIGACLGVYAISQMAMQIPFGVLSDKKGRKNALFIGTIIFIIGSLICAYADSIYMLFMGRLIQGMGAIGAVGTAMISDLIKEEKRAKAMAFMGAVIALSFAFSMIFGPIIGGYFGVEKLFLLTAALGILSLFLIFKMPSSPTIKNVRQNVKVNYLKLLRDENLCRMNLTNFLQKTLMTAAFMSIPLIMIKKFGFEKSELWHIYLPAMIFGLLSMVPSVIIGEKMKKSKEMLCIGILFFALSYFFMGYAANRWIFLCGVIIFFVGFNIHEPLMQSMTSKYAKVENRGATLGVFNVFGYFGTFFGGIAGGFLLKTDKVVYMPWVIFFVCTAWFFLIWTLRNPAFFRNVYINLSNVNTSHIKNLQSANGVIEWYIKDDELVIKFDTKLTNEDILNSIVSG